MKEALSLQPISGLMGIGLLCTGLFMSGCSSTTYEKPNDAFQSSMAVKVSIDEPLSAGSEEKSVNSPANVRTGKPVDIVAVKAPSSAKKDADHSDVWSQIKDFFAIEKVRPWQKSILARDTMKAAGPIPGSEKFSLKVYTSKEGSRGGTGVAGGGCGCN